MQENKGSLAKWLPLIVGCCLAFGMWMGVKFFSNDRVFRIGNNSNYDIVMNYLQTQYVDTVNIEDLNGLAINEVLSKLDPYSMYIPASELAHVNEPLEGNFEGVGIEFYVLNDTILVVNAIPGGPSEAIGIRSGDKIISINGKQVAGVKISNADIIKSLRGVAGTLAKVKIQRSNSPKLLDFTIKRDKIPLYSVDIAYMLTRDIGYLKINKFSATTADEVNESLQKLTSRGMKKLVLDLRGNGGGYLDAAIRVSDEFLSNGKLITYTKGRTQPKKEFLSTSRGVFEKGEMVVLIDEGSASASEIVSGALQDWDRATVIGRRSFGKGLVQEQYMLPDGSGLRLTVSKYYTPTGRSIQKPFDVTSMHDDEVLNRFKHGELYFKDSIIFNQSLVFTTPEGKKVYGGGGIMPSVFIPADSLFMNEGFGKFVNAGTMISFSYNFVDKNREMLSKFSVSEVFAKEFIISDQIFTDFLVESQKMVGEKLAVNPTIEKLLKKYLKANIARQLLKNEGYYNVINTDDEVVKASIEYLK